MSDWSIHGDGQEYLAHDRTGAGPWGVAVTSSGVTHTKGSWEALTAASAGSAWAYLHLHGFHSVTGSPSSPLKALVDLAVGGSGSEVAVVSNVLWMQSASLAGQPVASTLPLPLAIPAGSSLSARVQASDGVPADFGVSLTTVAAGWGASAPGNVVQAWGADTAATDGTNVTPGTAPAFGSYAQLTASSASHAAWVVLCFAMPGSYPVSGTTHAYLADLAVGGAGSEQVIVPKIPLAFTSDGLALCAFTPPLPVSIPAGSRVSVRTTTSTTGPNLSAVAYAIGG